MKANVAKELEEGDHAYFNLLSLCSPAEFEKNITI
jgi:hypothetical protein